MYIFYIEYSLYLCGIPTSLIVDIVYKHQKESPKKAEYFAKKKYSEEKRMTDIHPVEADEEIHTDENRVLNRVSKRSSTPESATVVSQSAAKRKDQPKAVPRAASYSSGSSSAKKEKSQGTADREINAKDESKAASKTKDESKAPSRVKPASPAKRSPPKRVTMSPECDQEDEDSNNDECKRQSSSETSGKGCKSKTSGRSCDTDDCCQNNSSWGILIVVFIVIIIIIIIAACWWSRRSGDTNSYDNYQSKTSINAITTTSTK